ncbi:TetR/AcrR family transcriptional regulator [Sulfurimonas sp.]
MSKQNAQPTREKILDVVFELVYIYGYHGTSMSMILKECAIPKGSLYHHFKSKKDMVLAVIKERLAPKMDAFYEFNNSGDKNSLDTLTDSILNIAQKEQLVKYGCPLNRLNQEMSPVDKDFESAIILIYNHIRAKIVSVLDEVNLEQGIETKELAEFIIATVWGALSLSPIQSSKDRYLATVSHLVSYLQSLKN